MLNMTKVELELISDAGKCLLFEKGIRGHVSYISKRRSQTNNKDLKSYDQKQEPKHIKYLDANISYNNVMSKFLPTSEFKWIDLKDFDVNKYNSNSFKGCI